MPSADAILDNAALIANRWSPLAVGWHAVFVVLVLCLTAGWRPSTRFAGYVLAAPLFSVSILAWAAENPFNGTIFAALALFLVRVASRFSRRPIDVGSRLSVAAGAVLVAFGWTYPHFLNVSHWTAYTYAAPLGLLPCPTLSAVIGFTLAFGALRSTAWSVALASAGFVYGIIGVFVLGVALDYALLAGAIVLLMAAERQRRRSVATVRRAA